MSHGASLNAKTFLEETPIGIVIARRYLIKIVGGVGVKKANHLSRVSFPACLILYFPARPGLEFSKCKTKPVFAPFNSIIDADKNLKADLRVRGSTVGSYDEKKLTYHVLHSCSF